MVDGQLEADVAEVAYAVLQLAAARLTLPLLVRGALKGRQREVRIKIKQLSWRINSVFQ